MYLQISPNYFPHATNCDFRKKSCLHSEQITIFQVYFHNATRHWNLRFHSADWGSYRGLGMHQHVHNFQGIVGSTKSCPHITRQRLYRLRMYVLVTSIEKKGQRYIAIALSSNPAYSFLEIPKCYHLWAFLVALQILP